MAIVMDKAIAAIRQSRAADAPDMEHSGGEPEYGFENSEKWDEESSAVSTIPDETLSLDSIDDTVKEEIRCGRSVKNLVLAAANALRSDLAAIMLARCLPMILEAPSAKLCALQIMHACGMGRESGPSIAKRFHVRKQDFYQGVEKIKQELGLRKTSNMRSDDAREKMSKRNQRNTKMTEGQGWMEKEKQTKQKESDAKR